GGPAQRRALRVALGTPRFPLTAAHLGRERLPLAAPQRPPRRPRLGWGRGCRHARRRWGRGRVRAGRGRGGGGVRRGAVPGVGRRRAGWWTWVSFLAGWAAARKAAIPEHISVLPRLW